ncbi:MAG: Ig-like domain-containing protein [Lachnospiraceae bacterium]|nr:Ig-like domain-containing protein [Lachnospiraceae bacterium]
MSNYIEIEGVSGNEQNIIKEDMKYRTGKFVWRVSFSAPLNPATVNNMNLYVTDASDKPLKTLIHYDPVGNYIEIEPREAYVQNTSYVLTITKNVESKGGQKLKNEMKVRFHV